VGFHRDFFYFRGLNLQLQRFFKYLIIFSFSAVSCTPCNNRNCLNGGTCIEGNCFCPAYVSGEDCETVDPCFDVLCQNGGQCDGGTCNCPNLYFGDLCQNTIFGTYKVTESTQVYSVGGRFHGFYVRPYPRVNVTITGSHTEGYFIRGYFEFGQEKFSISGNGNVRIGRKTSSVVHSYTSDVVASGKFTEDYKTIHLEFEAKEMADFPPYYSKSTGTVSLTRIPNE